MEYFVHRVRNFDDYLLCKHQISKYRSTCKDWDRALQHKTGFDCRMDNIECQAWNGDSELIEKMDALIRLSYNCQNLFNVGEFFGNAKRTPDELVDGFIRVFGVSCVPAHGWLSKSLETSEYRYKKVLVKINVRMSMGVWSPSSHQTLRSDPVQIQQIRIKMEAGGFPSWIRPIKDSSVFNKTSGVGGIIPPRGNIYLPCFIIKPPKRATATIGEILKEEN
jgi:hypothetical protein